MSSRPPTHASRSIRRLKHLRSGPLTSEPLWFLYPSCFKPSSFHRYHTERALGQDNLRSHQHKGRDDEDRTHSRPSKQVVTQSSSSSPFAAVSARKILQSPAPNVPRDSSLILRPKTNTTASIKPSKSDLDSKRDKHDTPVTISRTVLAPNELFRKLVPWEKWIRRVSYIPRQEVLERRAHFIREVNPKSVFSMLSSVPTRPRVEAHAAHCLRIEVSPEERKELAPGWMKENAWLHNDGSNCTIKLFEDHIELYGSDRAREIAHRYYSDSLKYTRSQTHLEWNQKILRNCKSVVAEIQQPPVWTVRSVIDYVSFLIRPYSRTSAIRGTNSGAESLHNAVFIALEKLFSDPESRTFLSTRALALALSYCRRHTEHPSTAARLWDTFSASGIQPDVHCFNEELGRCLVGKDFNRFHQRVCMMKELGVSPDLTTWAIALTWADSPSSRAQALRLIEEKSLSNPGENRAFVLATAKQAMKHFSGTEKGVQHLIQYMDSRFGPHWLTSSVIQRLLRECRVGHANEGLASALLTVIRERGQIQLLDEACVIELLQIARKARNLGDALELVKLEALSPTADIPQAAISLIFIMAWRRRLYNLCRLFWFLGATSGRISYDMQKMVRESLRRNISKAEDSVDAHWDVLAGKFVIGTDLSTDGFATMFPHLSKFQELTEVSPIEWLLQWFSDGDLRNEQVQLGQLLIERDLNAYRSFHRLSRGQFLDLMDEAVERDNRYTEAGAQMTDSPAQLLREALHIPLVRRTERIVPINRISGQAGARKYFTTNQHQLDYISLHGRDNANDRSAKELSSESSRENFDTLLPGEQNIRSAEAGAGGAVDSTYQRVLRSGAPETSSSDASTATAAATVVQEGSVAWHSLG